MLVKGRAPSLCSAGSVVTYHIGSEAWLILPLEQLTPVNIGKEVVRFDFRSTIGTESAVWITIKKPSEKVPCGRGNDVAAWERQRLLQDLAIHIICVLVIERWKTRQHLIEKYTQSPPVDCLGVSLA